MKKFKVFLSDPQVLFREGIHFILSGEDDFEVTGETTSNEEAYTHIVANPPDIAVLSLSDTTTGGADITRRIKRNLGSVSVVLTIDSKTDENLFSSLKSGASACITKDTDPEYLLDIIRVVVQGAFPILDELATPGLASLALAEFTDIVALNDQVGDLLASLTAKESQILTVMAAGNTLEQVNEKLDLTEEATRRHLRTISNKLVANDRARMLIDAVQRNLPSLLRSAGPGPGSDQYVSKTEFNDFKEQLMERLKSIVGSLT